MIGQRVRKRRRDLDMSQKELEVKSGVKQYHISLIEKGDVAETQTDTLRKLTIGLDVSADWLIGLKDAA